MDLILYSCPLFRVSVSPYFEAPKDDQILIVRHKSGDPEDGEDGHFLLYHLDSSRVLENLNFPYSQDEYPFKPEYCELLGSECGIVCVSVWVTLWRAKSNLYLWNPASKQSKIIPPSTIPNRAALGFGFDHIDLDFKVVRVISGPLSAEVYSLNRNEWRKIKHELINLSGHIEFHVCFHGFLVAIFGYYSCIKGMIAFDLNKEVFICDINLPVASSVGSSDDAERSSGTHIAQYKDTIAFIFYDSLGDNNVIRLWTLDNEACLSGGGVEALWTKVLSLDLDVPFFFVEGLFNNIQLLLYGVDGDRLLYNSKNKLTTEVPRYFNVAPPKVKYKKSLFSLTGFKRIKWAASSSRSQESSEWELEMDNESISD